MTTTTDDGSEDGLSFNVHHNHRPTPASRPDMVPSGAQPAPVELKKEEENGEVEATLGGIGLLPQEVYDRQLQPWAAATRRFVLRHLQAESEVLAAMQVRTGFSPRKTRPCGRRTR